MAHIPAYRTTSFVASTQIKDLVAQHPRHLHGDNTPNFQTSPQILQSTPWGHGFMTAPDQSASYGPWLGKKHTPGSAPGSAPGRTEGLGGKRRGGERESADASGMHLLQQWDAKQCDVNATGTIAKPVA